MKKKILVVRLVYNSGIALKAKKKENYTNTIKEGL